MKKHLVLYLIFGLFASLLHAQTIDNKFIRDLALKIDTGRYLLSNNTLKQNGETKFYFSFQKEDEICELNIYPIVKDKIKHIKLIGAADYVPLDSFILINNEYYRLRLKFVNLFKSQFLNFTLSATIDGVEKPVIEEIKLLPFTKTNVSFGPSTDDLFIGEEKVFLISTTHGGETHSLAAAIATIDFYKKESVIERLHQTGKRLIELTQLLITKHGLGQAIEVIPTNWTPVFLFKDASGQISPGFRTLFMQEMISHGVHFQGFFVPSFSHTEDDLFYFAKAFETSMSVYAEALKNGYEKYLVGEPAKAVFRKIL